MFAAVAASSAVLALYSYVKPVCTQLWVTYRYTLLLHCERGHARLYWYSCENGLVIDIEPNYPLGTLRGTRLTPRTSNTCTYNGPVIVSPVRLREFGMPYHHLQRSKPVPPRMPGCPPVYSGYLRTPIGTITIIFAVFPTIAFIGGPLRRWHRLRRGLCASCGYSLQGLTDPRCPECGTVFERINNDISD